MERLMMLVDGSFVELLDAHLVEPAIYLVGPLGNLLFSLFY